MFTDAFKTCSGAYFESGPRTLASQLTRKVGALSAKLERRRSKRTDKQPPAMTDRGSTKAERLDVAGVSARQAKQWEKLAALPTRNSRRWPRAPTVASRADRSSWTAGRRWDPTTANRRLAGDLKAPDRLLAPDSRKVRPASERLARPRFAGAREVASD